MAGQRLTDKSAATSLASDDLLLCVDVSDSTGSAEGTSKKIEAKHVIVTDAISISALEFQSLNSSPITLVAAQGAGWAILPISSLISVNYGTTTQTAKVNLYIGHEGTGLYYWGYKSGFMHNIATDAAYSFSLGGLSTNTTAEDKALKLHSQANFTFDATATVYITYQVVAI